MGDIVAGSGRDILQEPRASEARLAADLAGMRRLYELHARLANETDLHVALEEILAAACEFTKTERGCIQLVSDDGERLEMFAWRGYTDSSPFINHFRHEGSKVACDMARRHKERLVIEDVENFPPLAGTPDREVALAENIRATQSTPLVTRRGEMVGVLNNQFSAQHRPADDQLRLIDLLAWTAADFVARHRAEEELRRTAERNEFRVALADALRALTDPVAVRAEAARLLGEHLGSSRAFFGERDADGEHFLIERDYTRDGVPGIIAAGRYRLSDFGQLLDEELRAGRTVVVADVAADARLSDGERAACAAIGVAAHVCVPLMREGRFAAFGTVHQAEPRDWRPDEVALVEEVVERTWGAVERVRAEERLRASEQRLQRMVNVPRVGVLTFDYAGALLDANDAFLEMAGYTRDEVAGQKLTWRDFTPPEYREASERVMDSLLEGRCYGTTFSPDGKYIRRYQK